MSFGGARSTRIEAASMWWVDMAMISDVRWGDRLDIRATQPEAIGAALAARTPRAVLADDGATFIIAIDHPARGMAESRVSNS